jgi:hypothetical protein
MAVREARIFNGIGNSLRECPEIGGIAGACFVEGQHMSRHFSSEEVA